MKKSRERGETRYHQPHPSESPRPVLGTELSWESTYLACAELWVQFPALKKPGIMVPTHL